MPPKKQKVYIEIENTKEWETLLEKESMFLAYFSLDKCNVCKQLKPQVRNLLEADFPKMKMVFVDIEKQAEISAQNTVFAIPTIVLYTQSKEAFRKSRFIGIAELKSAIERPYKILF